MKTAFLILYILVSSFGSGLACYDSIMKKENLGQVIFSVFLSFSIFVPLLLYIALIEKPVTWLNEFFEFEKLYDLFFSDRYQYIEDSELLYIFQQHYNSRIYTDLRNRYKRLLIESILKKSGVYIKPHQYKYTVGLIKVERGSKFFLQLPLEDAYLFIEESKEDILGAVLRLSGRAEIHRMAYTLNRRKGL
jgi:hypothetical protein